MKKVTLSIGGMTCAACSSGLEKFMKKQDGIEDISVNLVLQNASISYDETKLELKDIEKLISKSGFKSLGIYKQEDLKKEKKKNILGLVISTILAIALMYISMGSMIGLPEIPIFSMHTNPIGFVLIQIVLVIYFLVYGYDILKNGVINLIHLNPNMDTLVLIGVASGTIYSFVNATKVFQGDFSLVHDLYFESCAIVIYFIKLGRFIEESAIAKTKSAITNLVTLTPKNALKKQGRDVIEVPLSEIQKGDILVAKPGMKIAVDGTIVDGTAHIDESLITGESKPVKKQKEDKIIAGSININGNISYIAQNIGKESTISQIIDMVVAASSTKPKFATTVDKVSNYFVPVVIIIAVLTLFVYLLTGNPISTALIHFMSVLVVACPCSLGLATPLAIVVSQGICAKSGLIIRNSQIFEKAKHVNYVLLDKTGTLTNGNLSIFKVENFSNQTDKQILKTIASIEAKSTHPIKNAFLNYVEDKNLKLSIVDKFEQIPGMGLVGKIDGKQIIVGNRAIIEKYQINNKHRIEEEELSKQGCSIVYLASNKEILAIVGIKDMIKKDSKKLITTLKKEKIIPIMLTGDNTLAANTIAKELGVEKVIANIVPQDKAKEVEKLQNEGNVTMMVGDGINDSIALTLSDVGVSFSNGTDIAVESSDVVINNSNLLNIYNIILISKKTLNIIYQNLIWAFIYNIAMIPIAMGLFSIELTPMIASGAMVLSSILVVLNSLRLNLIKTQN